jgi:hypothetical protein
MTTMTCADLATGLSDAIRMMFGQDVHKAFWSERAIDVADVLGAISERLERDAAICRIDIDRGWWPDRDVTVVVRGGVRLDVQALIELHDGRRCLCKFRIRPHVIVPSFSTVCGVLAAIVLPLGGPAASVSLSAVCLAAVVGHFALSAMVMARAFADVAAGIEMQPMPSKRTRLRVVARSS